MKEVATITVMALLIGGVALEKGLPASQPAICLPSTTVVQFLPVPEPSVISPAINIALPQMTLSLWSSGAKEEPKAEKTKSREPILFHKRHGRRHYRRRS